MKICIIGSGGFLATTLLNVFANEHFEVMLMGRTKPSDFPSHAFLRIDLLSGKLPVEEISRYEVIIYTAALGVQSSVKVNNEDIVTVNASVPIHLCESLNRIGYQGIFISFGSYFEIGNVTESKEFSEAEVIHSKADIPNMYCLSKRFLSQYFQYSKLGLTHYHFILPTIYGEGENPSRLIPYTIDGFKNKKSMEFTSGKQIRQYLWVEDAARLILACLRDKITSGIYNFPSAEDLSVKELVQKIGKTLGAEVPDDWFNKAIRQDVSMPVLKISASKLGEKIKIHNLLTIEEFIRRG